MTHEVDPHNKMLQHLVNQTGLDRDQIERICYAGEPWAELERLSGFLLQAIQHAKTTGSNPAVPLDALNSLMKLEIELREKNGANDNISSEVLRLQKKVEQISNITKEFPETVKKVVSAIIDYSYIQMDKARKAMGGKGKQ
jgi:hypothetical protein